MSLETIHIILNVIMVFAALYLICIAAFTYGLSSFRAERSGVEKSPAINDETSILSDIYSAMGMKIVLSGADSLGF